MVKCINSIRRVTSDYTCVFNSKGGFTDFGGNAVTVKPRIWCDKNSEKGYMISCITAFENVEFTIEMAVSK